MIKSVKSLSPTEQMLYSKLYPKRVVNTSDINNILKDKHKSADYITNLREKGFLQKIKRGVYAVVPPDALGKEYSPDKFLVGGKLKKNYYISHHSALELHGLAESIFNIVYITSNTYSQPLNHRNITYKFVTTKYFFGIEETQYKGETLEISDIEKTFLDCIRRIKYTGGLEELIKSLQGIPDMDYKKIWNYLKKFDETFLYHKAGFFLEFLDNLSPPSSVLRKIQQNKGKRVYYLYGKENCVYKKKWNLMMPKNFKELVTFA